MGSAVAIIGAVYSIYSGMQEKKASKAAAKEQEAMAARNAALSEAETREEAARMQQAKDEQMAKSRAKAAASGVQTGGSMDIFMGAQDDKLRGEIDWLKKSGSSRADLIRQGGAFAASQTRQQGSTALASGIAGAIGGLGSAYDSGKFDSWFGP